MNFQLQDWLQRLLAVAILSAVIIAVFTGIVRPVIENRATLEAERVDLGERYDRFRLVAAEGADLRRQLTILEGKSNLRAKFFVAQTYALAGAELQKQVNTIVRANNGTTRSVQTLPQEDDPQDGRFAVRATFTASIAKLQAILHALENSEKTLLVDRLEIRRPRRAARNRTNLASNLSVSLVLLGYFWPQE